MADTAQMKTTRALWVAAAALCASACGGQSGPGSPAQDAHTSLGTLQIRTVSSTTPGQCSAPPLTGAAAGRTCSLDSKTTYDLGPSLGELTVTGAQLAVDPPTDGQVVVVDVDRPSAKMLKDVTTRSVGESLAVLLGGRVATAATVQGPIGSGRLQLASGDPAVVAQVAASLHAAPAPPEDTSGDVSPPSAQDTAKALAVCRNNQPAAAAGMHVEAHIVNAPQTAANAATWMAQMGDSAAGAVWSRQPADEPVFLCNYVGPQPKQQAVPSCPPGQTPVVDDLGPTRAFLIDGHGHATELKVPAAAPTSGCSSD